MVKSLALISAFVSCAALPNAVGAQTVDSLSRRGLSGAQPAPVSAKIQEQHGLDNDSGVVLIKVFPNTAAAEAGLQAGDIALTVDGVAVIGVADFLKKIGQRRAGNTLTLKLVRDGGSLEKRATLKEFPREKDDLFDVSYEHVMSCGARLRTIVTRPKAGGPHPAVLLLQGSGNFSIDNPIAPPTGLIRIAHHLGRNGYVTMRVDRGGCGDSEGGPIEDMDFETELDGYRQALRALRSLDSVDPGNVFIYGQSIGGFNGPILAAETPVRGIVTHGTTAGWWLEGILAQRRQWASLDGTSPAEVEDRIRRESKFWYPLLVDKKTPAEIRKLYPDNVEAVEKLTKNDTHIFGRQYAWLHQIVDRNMGEVWTKVASTPLDVPGREPVYPKVLSIWGTSDWISERQPSEWIAEVVNRASPGHGKFVALESSDHFCFRAESMQESFRYFQPPKEGPFGKFNPAILKTVQGWLDETVAMSKQKGPDENQGLDKTIKQAMKQWHVPGLSIAVVRDGEVVLSRGYGVTKAGGQTAVTKDTLFPLASCTKAFTSTTIGMLVDEGKLSWDDRVYKHIADFQLYNP